MNVKSCQTFVDMDNVSTLWAHSAAFAKLAIQLTSAAHLVWVRFSLLILIVFFFNNGCIIIQCNSQSPFVSLCVSKWFLSLYLFPLFFICLPNMPVWFYISFCKTG